MTWVKLDDKFHDNPKQLRASDGAFRVWVCSMSYCADTPTPSGFMTTAQARGLITKLRKSARVIDELLALGAWEQSDDGYLLHDFEFGVAKSSAERVRRWRDLKRQSNGAGNALPNRYSSRARDGKPVPVVDTPSVVSTPGPVPGNAPPSPSALRAALSGADRDPDDDLGLALAVRVSSEVMKRDLSPLETALCEGFIAEYAYLSVDAIVERMHSQLEWGKQQKLDPPSSLAWFTQSLRVENDHQADAGAAKAWRPPPVAGDLSRLAP